MNGLLKLSETECDVDEFKDIIKNVENESLTKETKILPSMVSERKEISKLVRKALAKEQCYNDSKFHINNKICKIQCKISALLMQLDKIFEEPTNRYENLIKETTVKIDEASESMTDAVNNYTKETSLIMNMLDELPTLYDKEKLREEVDVLRKECEESKSKVIEMTTKMENQKYLLEEFNRTKGDSGLNNLATVLKELGDWGAEEKYLKEELKYWEEGLKTLMNK